MVSIASGVSSDENTVKKVGNLRTSKYNSPIHVNMKIEENILRESVTIH